MNDRPDASVKVLIVAAAAFLLLVSGVGAVLAFGGGGLGRMTAHGWAALAIAVVFTGGLAAGLIGLAFYSSRRGYDELGGAGPFPIDGGDDPEGADRSEGRAPLERPETWGKS